MARRQRDDFVAVVEEQGISRDKERIDPLLHDGSERVIDMGFGGGIEDPCFLAERLRCGGYLDPLQLAWWIVRVRENGERLRFRDQLAQQLQPFCRQRGREEGDTRDVAAGPADAGD